MGKSYFQWDDDLVTGISSVDEQHRALIEVINEGLQLCFSNREISLDEINKIHRELSRYVKEHFSDEEDLMKKYSLDPRFADEHSELHRAFEMSIEEFFSDTSSLVQAEKLGEIIEYLIRWLAYHILNMDKSLARQIKLIDEEGLDGIGAYEQEQNSYETSNEPLLKALRSLFFLVSEKNKALSQANAELEDRVQKRTAELMEANKKLKQVSLHDELTGLPNRRHAIIEIEKLIYNFKRYGSKFSLLYIDVDKFKGVNDNYGHEYGDKVLQWIADFFRDNLRESDIPCRLGGDEFLIICSHCDYESVMKVGEKLIKASKTYDIHRLSNCWEPSLSIGAAEIDKDCLKTNDILKKADDMMYVAKKKGGNFLAGKEN